MAARPLVDRLRRRIVLQREDKISNGAGGRKPNPETGGWAKLADTYAEIIALRGNEAVRENIDRAVQLWRVTIRFRPDVTPKDRVLWGTIVMNIKAAAPDEDGTALVMTCESGANGS